MCDVGGDLLLVRDNGESFGPVVVGPSDGVQLAVLWGQLVEYIRGPQD